MTWWQMYLLLKLDDVQVMFLIFSLLSGVASLIVFIGHYVVLAADGESPFKAKHLWALGIVTFLAVAMATITPTTKQAAMVYVTPKIINAVSENEELKKIPQSLIALANSWIEELKPEKEMEKK